MYKLLYHPNCLKRLRKIPQVDRDRILKKLINLSCDPFLPSLDVKKLAKAKNSFRLRSGDLRAIYELDKQDKIIYVWEIDYRGKVY